MAQRRGTLISDSPSGPSGPTAEGTLPGSRGEPSHVNLNTQMTKYAAWIRPRLSA